MKMIRSKDLVYEYHTHNDQGEIEELNRAIDHVDIDIDKGQFIAILGHNGSGKSTLAKHINALLTPSKGSIWVKGMDTKNEQDIWNIRQTAGMVFQNPDNQIIATVVEEDVAFGPENLGINPEDIRKRVDKSLKTVSMESYSTHSPNKLSGGQKQRIAIAGVLAMKPECIILDEPTAMLDPSGREEVIETVKFLNKEENITIILITHYMEEAIEADKVFVMDQGKIALQGNPKEVFVQVEKMKSLGLDVPQVTELTYMLRKKNINLPANILNVKEMVDALCQLK
ncbi:MAG: energy-coupling factor transporter ATPase [Vallitalea sp.]|jgi:energy-coupling factor transporter ATPase|nr:energy-coupling factor transporter ATPase [Vallitalea sp.]